MKRFAIILFLLMPGYAILAQDAEAEAILGDSVLLIQKVNLCAEIDIEAISVSDSFTGAELFGDFVYWERPLSLFLADSCYWDYTCRPRHALSGYDGTLRVKIALWRHGFMYCGVEGDTSSALFMLCNGGIGPVATWGRPLSWDDVYTDPFFTMDFSQNMLAQLIHHQYTKITDLGYIISGELPVIRDRMCLDPPTDSTGIYLYGFNLLAFSLKNNIGRTIWSIASQIATSRTDNVYSGSCWYAGIPVIDGPTGIVPFILNTSWCALCEDSTGLVTGTQSRGFSMNYIAPEHSAIRMTGGSNNMTEAWGFLDGVERMYILNCCTRDYPRANYFSFGDFPDSVRLRIRIDRAAVSSRFRMAVAADSLWFGDIWEDPSPGLSDNPSPLLLRINPGWNGKLYPEIEITPPDTLDLGIVLVGESAIRSFTVNNIGDTTLIITTLASSNPDNFGTHYTVNTPAGESSLITVSFNPSSAGEFSATLAIYTNVPCKSLIYVHVRGKAVAVDPLVPYIVEPLPGTWTSCDDQPIILGAICADTTYTDSDTLRINSLPSTTEYFDSLTMEWVPAESVWSSAWGTTIIPGTNWLWDSSFEREECIDFRIILNIPEGANIDSASISLHADNQATVYVNGAYIDTTHSIYWHRLHTFDIAPFLHSGSDTILIHACDISGVTAGLNFYVFVSYSRVCCRAVELSTVVLDVNSAFHHGGDGSISILDDTLIFFNPPEPFEDGDTVRVCLASAADTCGAIFRDLPLCWDFMVDLTPPVPILIFPSDDATIMDSLPTISLILHDSLTGIDTASVVFTVMDEEIPVELIAAEDGYLLEWTLARPVFHGDTVHFCVHATDTTDYCPNNILDTCFSFNIFSEGPVAELLSPHNSAISACIDQNIVISIIDPEGIDPASIRIVVESDILDISDPRLNFVDGSMLIFTPSPVWEDLDTIRVSLISADDAFGAPLVNPFNFIFYTDFSPPSAVFLSPPSDEFCINIHESIEIQIADLISPILVDSSFIEVNGDAFSLGDVITTINPYGNEISVVFRPIAFSMAWIAGDTVDVALTVCDEPDTCAPNCAQYMHSFIIEPTTGCGALPNPFSPNSDGINDAVIFEYPRMFVLPANLKIFDLRNSLVFEREIAPETGEHIWNGCDTSGIPLAPGLYIYIIATEQRIVCQGTVVLVR